MNTTRIWNDSTASFDEVIVTFSGKDELLPARREHCSGYDSRRAKRDRPRQKAFRARIYFTCGCGRRRKRAEKRCRICIRERRLLLPLALGGRL